jgi:hypothetical protein
MNPDRMEGGRCANNGFSQKLTKVTKNWGFKVLKSINARLALLLCSPRFLL